MTFQQEILVLACRPRRGLTTFTDENHNDFPDTIPIPNTVRALTGGPNDRFTDHTKRVMGRKAEFADAFVWGSMDLAVA